MGDRARKSQQLAGERCDLRFWQCSGLGGILPRNDGRQGKDGPLSHFGKDNLVVASLLLGDGSEADQANTQDPT